MSTYGIPQIIYSLDETAKYMGIPRGCRSSLIRLFDESNVNYLFEYKRNRSTEIHVNFKGVLHEDQQLAADSILQHENGILSVPTAFGKTLIGASFIAQKKCNTLILFHLHTFFNQWKKALEQFLEINETFPETARTHEDVKTRNDAKDIQSFIGQIGAGKNTLTDMIDIVLV